MSRFVEIPDLQWVGGDMPWLLKTRMVFISDAAGEIVVPEGFRTDLASVPRLPFIHLWTGGRANMPAVLHDYLYSGGMPDITRAQADRAFLESMAAVDEPKWAITRRAMWLGVRVGGWRYFRRAV